MRSGTDKRGTARRRGGRLLLLLLCLLLAVLSVPFPARAEQPESKRVRVGWYDSPYNTMDQYGRRSGYAYEYQLKIACYTGWTYEYVTGSWPQLLEMLETGEIDLMSDVSYTPERAEKMLYPSLPMGSEEYYLFTSPGKRGVLTADPATHSGKRIGVNKNSIQGDFYRAWAERNGADPEILEVSGTENESLAMLETGELDGYVTVDAFVDPEQAVPVCKVGSSDFYFAVSKARPDLLVELNEALNRIQDENRYYNQRMFEKYIKRAGANAFLSQEEADWLADHGTIRLGYQDNYLAFCAADKTTGELTGVMKDYLAYAADCVANVHIDFAAFAYPTAADALAALKRGEVDCVFPANFSPYDAETAGLLMTPPITETEIYAVVSPANFKGFAGKEYVIVAVNEGNPNYDAFLLDNFPGWRRVYYPSTPDCLKAVADGVADCVLISNYRYNNIARLCERYRLVTFAMGVEMDYAFAVEKGQTALYSILTRVVGMVPKSTVNSAVSYYITADAKLSLEDFIVDHLGAVMAVTGLVLVVILALMVLNMRAARRAKALISATETDELSGLYNRGYFFQYADRMCREHPDTPMDAIVLNLEQFHSVNALNGRDFGDRVLRTLGGELRAAAAEHGGIAGRFEADRFDIYCRHTEDYAAIFARLQGKLDELSPNANLRLRMGVMPWQAGLEPVQLFDRARTACTMARGNYQERLVLFDEQARDREMYEQRLLGDLRRALGGYEFEVYYQPKYDIQSEPPRLVSAEALVRWNHPELGMIPPDDFIPLLEKNGQIGAVDQYVWSEAARQVLRWREEYGVEISVSVNLSRVDVFDPALERTLDGILAQYGLDRRALKLEVTESAYTENADQVIRVVESLRNKGYQVEMDDFGTGYSSLNMLSAMPIDVLKMDRAFIRNIEHSEKDIQLVALILDIARKLKIPVIAEGVETEGQMKLLRSLGCALVQGYYFSRPLPAADFEERFIRGLSGER
jgi:diguanylate cyclase (GGDEF)-like protein